MPKRKKSEDEKFHLVEYSDEVLAVLQDKKVRSVDGKLEANYCRDWYPAKILMSGSEEQCREQFVYCKAHPDQKNEIGKMQDVQSKRRMVMKDATCGNVQSPCSSPVRSLGSGMSYTDPDFVEVCRVPVFLKACISIKNFTFEFYFYVCTRASCMYQ